MSSTLKQKKSGLLIASSIAILFLIFNFILISNGHFHEDAYILFIYVENFVNGNGITYYSDGPHIEGATDFLWLMLLIFLVKKRWEIVTYYFCKFSTSANMYEIFF